ncbi:MAG: fibronectin type III domain-containing protein [Capnocytophaga sp.]|uniref:fibronectin type III domain-containing protein n=1 Tax=Capnocytophaga sp. TaxID=44737 RepID=UPI003F9F7E8E
MTKVKKLRKGVFLLLLAAVTLFGSCSKKKDEPHPFTLVEGKITIAGAIAHDKALVQWEAALVNRLPDNHLPYQVYWQAEGSNEIKNSNTLTDGSLEYTITELTEKTTYIVWVRVLGKAGNSKDYVSKKIITPAANSPAAEPSLFDKTTYIQLTTQQKEGMSISLNLQASTTDQKGVWLDLNGNGIYEPTIDKVPDFSNPNPAYIITTQTFRIYGKVHTLVSEKAELTEIELKHNPLLIQLNVTSNYLKEIDLQKNTELRKVNISDNLLESINLSSLRKLTDLDITKNMLFDESLKKGLETINSIGGTIHLTPSEKKDTAILAILKAKSWKIQ